jgi:nucleotide-binding universal stress UspA family protein
LGNRILVPVANPSTEDNLLNLALILTKNAGGTLLPLHVLSDRDGPILADAKIRQQQLLASAETIAHAAVTTVEPIGRVDDSIDYGIVRTAEERNASLVICGWKGYSTYRENFFGSVIDNVVRMATIPVLISRFAQPIENTQRGLLATSDLEMTPLMFQQTLSLTQTLAAELKEKLQVLQVLSGVGRKQFNLNSFGLNDEILVYQEQGNLISKVNKLLKTDDLLVLMASPRRLGQPAIGRVPEAIARNQTQTSILVIHFPDNS